MFATFEKIIGENGLNFEKFEFDVIHNDFAGKTTAEFIVEEKRLRALAEEADAENASRLEKTLRQIESIDASEEVKNILRKHAKIVFDSHYAMIYLSDEEMDLIA